MAQTVQGKYGTFLQQNQIFSKTAFIPNSPTGQKWREL
jgi:hypothetical protein